MKLEQNNNSVIKMHLKLPEYVLEVLNIFKNNNKEGYLVGGAVRDLLLNKEAKDFDISTPLEEKEIKELFKDYNFVRPNGFKHGTYTLRYKKHNVEITTFKYDENEEKCLKTDMNHRDLSINTLAYDGEYIYNYRNGLEDLNNKIVTMGDNPLKIINEDPLRMLRAIRFKAQLGFKIEEKTRQAILDNYLKLKDIAKERIIHEVLEILISETVEEILFDYEKIFTYLFPPLLPCVNFDQNNRWHAYDLYTHTVHVTKGVKADKNLRFAALLHDIGKVPTVSQEYIEGVGYINHYYGHPAVSKEMAAPILNEYKFSNYDKSEILFLINYHDNKIALEKKSIKKVLAKIDNFNPDNHLETLAKLVNLQHSDHRDHTMYVPIPEEEILSIAKAIQEEKDAFKLKDLAIDGRDLQLLGFKGKEIGDTLRKILDLVIEDKLKNNKEEIIAYIKNNKE